MFSTRTGLLIFLCQTLRPTTAKSGKSSVLQVQSITSIVRIYDASALPGGGATFNLLTHDWLLCCYDTRGRITKYGPGSRFAPVTVATGASWTHSARYIETSSSHIPDVPDYVAVAQLNDVQMIYYNGKDMIKYTDQWKAAVKDHPWLLEKETKDFSFYKVWSRISFEEALRDLNETQGAHVWQVMVECVWDDETEETSGVARLGLDGEGFASLNEEKEEWIAVTPQAQITTAHWNRLLDKAFMKQVLYDDCVAKLKAYLSYGQHTLRTELPLVSLLQKSSSAPVTCHATGFYPDRALLFWTKDGHELMEDEDVDPGEILPNGDGTFQTSVSLNLSSVPPEDWDRFHCVFQLSGVQDDYVTRLDRTKIRTNSRTDITTDIRTNAKAAPASIITAVVLGVVFIVSAAAAVVLFVTRRRRAQNNPQQDAQMRLNPNPVVQATNSVDASSSPDAETQTLNPESSE